MSQNQMLIHLFMPPQTIKLKLGKKYWVCVSQLLLHKLKLLYLFNFVLNINN